jgi:predicted RecA/RadA family phage recombinase
MKNFVQPGNVVSISAPKAMASGEGILIGKLFGISTKATTAAGVIEMLIEGVVSMKKAAGLGAFNEGDAVTFDSVSQTIVASGTAGAHVVGLCVEASSPDDPTYAWVKLIPSTT